MSYTTLQHRLNDGGVAILDGGTGTELERRGVAMHPDAWCGPATLDNVDILEGVHRDYIEAGADIITANTYASSRLMLGPAGFGDRLPAINATAVAAARRAREASGRDDVLVAGSLSHMSPIVAGTDRPDAGRVPSRTELADAFAELAGLLCQEGCDLILLEMMYSPERIDLAVAAAVATGLPVWVGFSVRRGGDGQLVGFDPHRDIPFAEIVRVLDGHAVAAAGIMHSPADLIGPADAILGDAFAGLRLAYPDSGHFRMPHWQFEDIIPPAALVDAAAGWIDNGVRIVGGCCGLSPDHIAALSRLKR